MICLSTTSPRGLDRLIGAVLGGERRRSGAAEGERQSCEDAEVGVKLNASEATGAERGERVAPMMGDDFAVVWVARPEEWEAATAEGCDPQGFPWPAEDVTIAEPGG